MVFNFKNYKDEIDDFNAKTAKLKKLEDEFRQKYSKLLKEKDFEELKKSYLLYQGIKKCKDIFKSLKSRTVNILRILKRSNIPFILCYFPKIGDEFPFYLFNAKEIFIEKK